MAKNRSMEAKHAKAKKCAVQDMTESARNEMCCKLIPHNYRVYESKSVFSTSYAIQKRIDAFIGKHIPATEFKVMWSEAYEYLVTHTVPEARSYFN